MKKKERNLHVSASRLAIGGLLLPLLAACTAQPAYWRPEAPGSAAFKEMPVDEETGTWQTAQPLDGAHRGEWWTIFADGILDALQRQAAAANQDLQAAVARLQQARALARAAEAERHPSLDGGFGPTRQRPSPAAQALPAQADTSAQTLWRAQVGASYEADLFGRVGHRVDAARADAASSEALFRSVQLALQADVAEQYFALRELDAQLSLYRQTVVLRDGALRLVERRYDAGQVDELDVAVARRELASAQAAAAGIARQRAAVEHALAVLLGMPPANFSLAGQPLAAPAVRIPAGLPSTLLERRPDIAAAERAMAAAHARVGLARAAFFPRLALTGSLGTESASLADLFRWSSRTFLLGPLAGTVLTVPLHDGGRRDAELVQARARFEEEVALYRQQVLVAFREVEDSLAALRLLGDQARAETIAAAAAQRAEALSQRRYDEGQIGYLEVIDAQRQVLQSKLQLNQLAGAQAAATVGLIRALGGGWDAPPAVPAAGEPVAAR